ncbi:hypothetical protein GIB67_011588 [Kingdonia uniflora]|uniref:Uncharacterized protein n=1 Tax=Kingdonia uniflora TaxID=39325 RepID=A0A7J7NM75_9MAGN|nr:hypothetical protein GIB67_011588 [Kingdonia uniflora]
MTVYHNYLQMRMHNQLVVRVTILRKHTILLQYHPERSCVSIMIWAWNDGCSTLHSCQRELKKQTNVTNDFKL